MPRDRWRSALRRLQAPGHQHDRSLRHLELARARGERASDFTGTTDPAPRPARRCCRLDARAGVQAHPAARPGDPQRVAQRRISGVAAANAPEYDMPLHDVLEGRYPATATLQNAHADDAAAAEWLGNATHLLESRRVAARGAALRRTVFARRRRDRARRRSRRVPRQRHLAGAALARVRRLAAHDGAIRRGLARTAVSSTRTR